MVADVPHNNLKFKKRDQQSLFFYIYIKSKIMSKRFINIEFPFQDSKDGFFLNMNAVDSKAIRSDLMHLILTRKGERFYNPDFGTDLLRFIFEPNDSITYSDIKLDIQTTVKRFIPNLNIDDVIIEPNEEFEYKATVRIDYTITDDVFSESDFIIINL